MTDEIELRKLLETTARVEDVVIRLIFENFKRIVPEKSLEDLRHNVDVYMTIAKILIHYVIRDDAQKALELKFFNDTINAINSKYPNDSVLIQYKTNPTAYAKAYARVYQKYVEIKNYLIDVITRLISLMKPEKHESILIKLDTDDINELKKKFLELLARQLKSRFVPVFIKDVEMYEKLREIWDRPLVRLISKLSKFELRDELKRRSFLVLRKRRALLSSYLISNMSVGDLALIQVGKNKFAVYILRYSSDKYYYRSAKVLVKNQIYRLVIEIV